MTSKILVSSGFVCKIVVCTFSNLKFLLDNNGISDLYDAAQSIPTIVNSDYFPQMFVTQLQAASVSMDKIDYK